MTEHTTLIANRYEVLAELGKGGMGAVYRVRDQLSGAIQALKRVLIPTDRLDFNLSNSSQNQYIALATEFRTLATLRHPHIIGVQDYGFGADGQPYFTMEYLPNASLITEYALAQPVEVKIRLLTEILQALAYLHQRRIIHRDIKPGNILVDQSGQVKVLDFGLAIATAPDIETETDRPPAGTVAYMAPELFSSPPSVQSDLYAVGLIAYEMFAGQFPYNTSSFMTLLDDVLRKQPDMSLVDSRLIGFVDRMIAKSPEARPQSAHLAIEELYIGLDATVPEESSSIRESFLQASSFVGRRQELNTFKSGLQKLKEGTFTAWLVGGESGSGKSRLVEELRTRALVQGVRVLRGQSAVNGLPYQTWRDVLRPLILMTDLSELEAGILKEVVPDMETLLGRSIPDVPSLSGKANQERLVLCNLDIFKRQAEPTLLILEDLHWASESIALLQTLLQHQQALKLMVVGTYRTDETPQLPEQLPEMTPMLLGRLDAETVAQLSQSMLGKAADDPRLLELLNKETEGNIFFIVEVMRALAEEAGSLSDIGKGELPQRVMAGGMQQVLRRRLSRMPQWAQSVLKLAAITGRQLDEAILKAAAPDADIENFVTAGANAAVFDVLDGTWRFAHDKLRETLLEDLADSEKPDFHRRVAEGIEATYPDDVAYSEMLAQHWDIANDAEKSVKYTIQAAQRMVEYSAEYNRAHALLTRALELVAVDHPEYARLRYYAGETDELQASYDDALAHYQASLAAAGGNQPLQIRALLAMGKVKARQGQLDETEQYLARATQIAQAVDEPALIADTLFFQGRLAADKGDYQTAHNILEQSLEIELTLERPQQLAATYTELGLISLLLGDHEQAKQYYERGLDIQRRIQDKHNVAISLGNLGYLALLAEDYDLAHQQVSETLQVFRDIGSRYGEALALIDLGSIAGARQEYEAAIAYFDQSLAINREIGNTGGIIIGLNEQASLYLSQEDIPHAGQRLLESIRLAQDIEAVPYLLTAIVLVGQLYLQDGRTDRSAVLVGFCAMHEAMPGDVRGRYLEPLQAELQATMDEADYQAALKTGEVYELGSLVNESISALDTQYGDYTPRSVGTTSEPVSLKHVAARCFGDLDQYMGHVPLRPHLSEANVAYPEGHPLEEVETLMLLAQTAYLQGDLSGAESHLERTTVLLAETEDVDSKLQHLSLSRQLAESRGDLGSARSYLEHAVDLQREQGDMAGVAQDLLHIGMIYARQGALTEAADYFEQSLTISRTLATPQLVALGLLGLGIAALLNTEYPAAEVYLVESAQRFQDANEVGGAALASYYLGTLMLLREDPAMALQHFEHSGAFYRLTQQHTDESRVLIRQAHACLMLNDLEQAQEHIAQSLMMARDEHNTTHMLAAIVASARLYFAQGEFQRSAALIGLCAANAEMPVDDALWYLVPLQAELEDQLGHEAFAKARETGQVGEFRAIAQTLISELEAS